MIIWIAALCFTIMMMLSISSVSRWPPPQQRTSGGGIASWLQAAKTHVRSLAALGEADDPQRAEQTSSNITKPPLYPSGFQLSNISNFTFVINNDVCGYEPVDIVMVVTSDTRRPSWRGEIRAALPSAVLAELRMRRVFLLAELAPPDNIDQMYDRRVAALQAENHEHEDLVVGSFRDAYRNLTYKHLMGLQWATAYCPQARYILKMDHDIVADVFQLARRLAALPAGVADSNTVIGAVFAGTAPIRETDNKWYVSKEEYPENSYPPYMSGWLYIITPDAASRLVAAGNKQPFFWVDDAFVTGVLRHREAPDIKMIDFEHLWKFREGNMFFRAGFRRVSNRCMIAWIVALCFTIIMMMSISSVSSWSHTRQRTNGSGIASWLQAVKTHVRSLAALGQASSSITKPPLYPPGFQLSNLNNFTFVINNDVCGNDPVDLVMVVTSDTRRPSWRAKTRAALPSSVLAEVRVRRVFLLAELAPPDNISQEYDQRVAALQAENHEYEDLVVGNFRDTYRNLTYKHLMGLHWATAYCPQARFIAKMDHDIVVDVFQLTPAKIVVAGNKQPFFWVDDAFVTGVLRHREGLDIKMIDYERLWMLTENDQRFSAFTMEMTCVYECAAEVQASVSHCNMMIGPVGDNSVLLRLFYQHTQYCHRHGCTLRSPQPHACAHHSWGSKRVNMPRDEEELGDVTS
ncbi:Beta-1,3-galactosyltransferase 5 [Amphibalanus amphitrite]|uniref:Beta-1,3-galactosyltransferase 5 n=1 Tax=Amphibalanus amphitrite TaxID=1232801 RepID=A0A6A4WH96_AMPAM|nr:Beta-1,3-galactosyltransferase 5 [Amphibalanus amphitrite]